MKACKLLILVLLLAGCQAQKTGSKFMLQPREIIESADTSKVDTNYFYRSHS